jgi:hypothetical protein
MAKRSSGFSGTSNILSPIEFAGTFPLFASLTFANTAIALAKRGASLSARKAFF